jgi:homoserine kinase type II
MAVYTDVNEDQLRAFLAEYDVGTLLSYKGIAEGVENSNFLLRTSGGTFILTLYEKRVNRDDLPFFLGLMDHLALKGLSCPLPIERRDGGHLGELAGRPAAMVSFLDGAWLRKPQAPHCREVGRALAAMHVAGSDFPIRRANGLTVAIGGPCGKARVHVPTKFIPASGTRSTGRWRSLNPAGRKVCRRA